MPDGSSHFAVGVIVFSTMTAVAVYERGGLDHLARDVLYGGLVGLLVTPDADVQGSTYTERILRHIPVVGFLWALSWDGYGALFKHRGLSHNLLLGTATRLLWLWLISAFWLVVAAGIIALQGGDPQTWPAVLLSWWRQVISAPLLLAWWLQDALHIVMDAL